MLLNQGTEVKERRSSYSFADDDSEGDVKGVLEFISQ